MFCQLVLPALPTLGIRAFCVRLWLHARTLFAYTVHVIVYVRQIELIVDCKSSILYVCDTDLEACFATPIKQGDLGSKGPEAESTKSIQGAQSISSHSRGGLFASYSDLSGGMETRRRERNDARCFLPSLLRPFFRMTNVLCNESLGLWHRAAFYL